MEKNAKETPRFTITILVILAMTVFAAVVFLIVGIYKLTMFALLLAGLNYISSDVLYKQEKKTGDVKEISLMMHTIISIGGLLLFAIAVFMLVIGFRPM